MRDPILAPAAAAAVLALAAVLLPPARAEGGPGAGAGVGAAELDAHADAVRSRLEGRGFTVVVEPPFVVVGDEAPATVRRRAATTLRWAVSRLERQFFPRRPDRVIEI